MQTCYVFRSTRTIADLIPPHEVTPGWCISRINVPAEHRGEGHGSAMLRMILRDADAEQVTLWLEVQPSGPLDRQQLTAWYKRYGFKPHKYGYMIRRPRKKKVTQ